MQLAIAYLWKVAFVLGGLVLLSVIGSLACWLFFGGGWIDLKVAWRVRRLNRMLRRAARRDRAIARKHASRSSIVGRDQVSPRERMKLVSQR